MPPRSGRLATPSLQPLAAVRPASRGSHPRLLTPSGLQRPDLKKTNPGTNELKRPPTPDLRRGAEAAEGRSRRGPGRGRAWPPGLVPSSRLGASGSAPQPSVPHAEALSRLDQSAAAAAGGGRDRGTSFAEALAIGRPNLEWQSRWPIGTRDADPGEWGLARGRLEGVRRQVKV